MKDNVFLAQLTKGIVLAIMAVNIAILITMPWMLPTYLGFFYSEKTIEIVLSFYYFMLYACGILTLLILNNLRILFDLMIKRTPFVRETEKRLQHMGWESILIAAVLFVKIFFYNSFMTITSVVVFIIAGLFCFILSSLFRTAVDIKEENDLTV